jgi:SynChlorMet cassette protein ScmC
MIDLITHFYSKGYRLRLSDGNDWWITGYGNSIRYVEEFADIMALEECQPCELPKLIYFKRAKDDIRKNTVFRRQNLSTAKVIFRVEDYRIILIWYGQTDAICELRNENSNEESDYFAMWYSLYAIYQRSMQIGGLPFHSGLAEFEGKGVLLAGSSGSGKSTCCGRLPDHWKPLCDDETLVVLSKDNIYQAHPCPTWSDYLSGRTEKKYNIQYSVPVSAFFFLEQSETDEVIPIPPHQASIFITRSSTQIFSKSEPFKHRKDRSSTQSLVFNNAVNMAKAIPAFILRVSFTGRFWEKIEEILKNV